MVEPFFNLVRKPKIIVELLSFNLRLTGGKRRIVANVGVEEKFLPNLYESHERHSLFQSRRTLR